MKIKVRQGIFETNSSSIHTICIHKKEDKKASRYVKLSFDHIPITNRMGSFEDKANYIYNLCGYMDITYPVLYTQQDKSYICRFFKFLEENNVRFEYNTAEEYNHCQDVDEELAEKLFSDLDLLYQFIFDDMSFVIIRNNNYRDDPLPEEMVEGFKNNYVKYEFDA